MSESVSTYMLVGVLVRKFCVVVLVEQRRRECGDVMECRGPGTATRIPMKISR